MKVVGMIKVEWVIEVEEDSGGIESRGIVVEIDGGYSIGGRWVW